jgi:hypothetical protein
MAAAEMEDRYWRIVKLDVERIGHSPVLDAIGAHMLIGALGNSYAGQIRIALGSASMRSGFVWIMPLCCKKVTFLQCNIAYMARSFAMQRCVKQYAP